MRGCRAVKQLMIDIFLRITVVPYWRTFKKVRYLGLLENVRVRRAGYAFRQSYNEFKTRYKMLSKETWPSSKHSSKSGMAKNIRFFEIF